MIWWLVLSQSGEASLERGFEDKSVHMLQNVSSRTNYKQKDSKPRVTI